MHIHIHAHVHTHARTYARTYIRSYNQIWIFLAEPGAPFVLKYIPCTSGQLPASRTATAEQQFYA